MGAINVVSLIFDSCHWHIPVFVKCYCVHVGNHMKAKALGVDVVKNAIGMNKQSN